MPLNEIELHDPIETGLSSSRAFIELQALRLWGVGLEGLRAWMDGKIDKAVLDIAVYFYRGHVMFENNKQDAIAIEQHNRSQKAKRQSSNK